MVEPVVLSQHMADRRRTETIEKQGHTDCVTLPIQMTRAASQQTYYTIRFLADRERRLDAFRAYAYFRWVDDCVDGKIMTQAECIAFLERQQALLNNGRAGHFPGNFSDEERLLLDLIRSDADPHSGLHAYIEHMMAVMAFDASRRGRLISEQELARYSCHLATAVTEALHYFIGHDDSSPQSAARYRAVTGAHITHMLRDFYEDIAASYFNIPLEYLKLRHIGVYELETDAFQEWVAGRVALARRCFQEGRRCLSEVKNFRCRLAGCAYIARFEVILDAIERDNYHLRAGYPERKSLRSALKMSQSILATMGSVMLRGTS
jgi:phytoene/squalene synthetase